MQQEILNTRASVAKDVSLRAVELSFYETIVGNDTGSDHINIIPAGPEELAFAFLQRADALDKEIQQVTLATYLQNDLVTVNFAIFRNGLPDNVALSAVDSVLTWKFIHDAISHPTMFYHSRQLDIALQPIAGSSTGYFDR